MPEQVPDTVKIRPFTENDFPAVLGIYHASKLDELRFETRQFELLPLEQDDRRFSEFKASDVYVCEDDGIIGYGAVCGSEIRALYVLPEMRGRGIGRQLLSFLLSKVTGAACLYVAKTNAPAKSLYTRYGFVVAGEFQTDYNGAPVLANKMVKKA